MKNQERKMGITNKEANTIDLVVVYIVLEGLLNFDRELVSLFSLSIMSITHRQG